MYSLMKSVEFVITKLMSLDYVDAILAGEIEDRTSQVLAIKRINLRRKIIDTNSL
jgi:hypothetical protein